MFAAHIAIIPGIGRPSASSQKVAAQQSTYGSSDSEKMRSASAAPAARSGSMPDSGSSSGPIR